MSVERSIIFFIDHGTVNVVKIFGIFGVTERCVSSSSSCEFVFLILHVLYVQTSREYVKIRKIHYQFKRVKVSNKMSNLSS